MSVSVQFSQPAVRQFVADDACMAIRRTNFSDQIAFHAPGLKRYMTSEYEAHDAQEFVAISITGEACALNCEHCKTGVLRGMRDLGRSGRSLYDLCSQLHDAGARGVLISGGSDRRGRVPLLKHMNDLIRVRRELGMTIRVHPGLPDEDTCAGLAQADIDGAMIDVIGHDDTIRDVYHLNTRVDEYEAVLERLQRHGVPCVPHIVMGLHYGKMLGEAHALEMISRYELKLLVLVILMPLSGTPMAHVAPPSIDEIGEFFALARQSIAHKPLMLGCARPLGAMKVDIDRMAIDSGFNGIAYPADGIVSYARSKGLRPHFINACCGVNY